MVAFTCLATGLTNYLLFHPRDSGTIPNPKTGCHVEPLSPSRVGGVRDILPDEGTYCTWGSPVFETRGNSGPSDRTWST